MTHLGTAVSIVVGLFALIGLLGVAYVWFRGSADKATLESQGRLLASRKEEIDDLTRRVVALETENRHLHEAVAQVNGIDHLQSTADAIKADTTAIRAKVLM